MIRVVLTVGAIFMAPIGLAVIAQGIWLLMRGGPEASSEILGGAFLVCWAVFNRQLARVRVDVDESGLRIVNLVHSESVPWCAVRQFRVGWAYFGITLDLTDGRSMRINAIQKSNWASMNGTITRADRIVADWNAFAHPDRSAVA